ncbi:hypothetical protein [Nocardioides sp. AE5]|uniref:hypothetical protein n=1 Tax=Nocardioides sp. AE5 TaxID=2962573 RepID=UPI002882634A|nr:hypothetical protein [Nocardioides sp. AE5]MDT0203880.1 hypothetical protein [Nocardioides sp. AE5]
MTTSTTRKASPLKAAQTKVAGLEDQERATSERRDKARAHLADLQLRSSSGDPSVTGLDLITARGEVEATENLAEHAAKVLAAARMEAAALLAEQTAQEARDSLIGHDPNETLKDAQKALQDAVTSVSDAIAKQDATSDAIGQKLASAGVPPMEWCNGIQYVPVRTSSTSSSVASTGRVSYRGSVIPGRFNVAIQNEDGEAVWLSSEGLTRDSNQVIDSILNQAWEAVRS